MATATIIPCPTREEWLAARRLGVGASEAGAILGLSPFKTALEVYMDKLGLVPPNDAPRLKWGLRLERVIGEAYSEETGLEISKPAGIHKHPDAPWMLASLDFIDENGNPVETKRASEYARKLYGDPGTEEIPKDYYLQVQQQIACTDTERASLAVLIGDCDFRIYPIARNQRVIDELIGIERDFMDRVERQDPPLPDFQHPSTADLLSLIEPDYDTAIALHEHEQRLADEYEAAGEAEREAASKRRELKARLLYAMGDAAHATLPDGRRLRRKLVEREPYTTKACSFIDFRILKARKGGE